MKQIVAVEKDISMLNGEVNKQQKYISSLRYSILQRAVEGKLCEQNPNDEPANVLLGKIKLKKEKMIGQKKIKRQKHLPSITDEEKPHCKHYQCFRPFVCNELK